MKNENAKNIVPISIAAASVVLILAIAYFTVNKKAAENSVPKKEAKTAQEQLVESIKTKNLNSCNEIVDEVDKKVCINNIAMALAEEKLDANYCQKLDGIMVSIEDCEKRIVFAKAFKEESVAACDTAPEDYKQQCRIGLLYQLALKKNDPGACEGLSEAGLIDDCKDNLEIQMNFQTNPESFACGVLRAPSAKADCQLMKKNLNAAPTEAVITICAKMKTPAFIQFCRAKQ